MSKPDNQLNLLDNPALKLSGVGRAVKLALNKAAAVSNLSRDEIVHRAQTLADEASLILCPGGKLSLATLNKWLDINASSYMPSLIGLVVLGKILKDSAALKIMADTLNLKIINEEEQSFLDMGRAYWQEKEARRRRKIVEARL